MRPLFFALPDHSAPVKSGIRSTDIGTLVTAGKIRLNRTGTDLVRMVDLVISNGRAQAVAADLLVGDWTVMVQLYDAGNTVIYSGQTSVQVFNGYTTQNVAMTLYRHQGDVLFDITLPTENSDDEDPMFGLVLWNKFESKSIPTDYNCVKPVDFNGSSVITNGKFGNSLYQPVDTMGGVSYIPAGTFSLNKFTVEFWVYASEVSYGHPRVFFQSESVNNYGFRFIYWNGWGNEGVSIGAEDANGNQVSLYIPGPPQADEFLPIDEWTHFAVTVDTSAVDINNRMKIFRNGSRMVSAIVSENNSAQLSAGLNNQKTKIFATRKLSSYVSEFGFGGRIDNLKIYNYAKTSFDLSQE